MQSLLRLKCEILNSADKWIMRVRERRRRKNHVSSLGETIRGARVSKRMSQRQLALLIKKEDGNPVSFQFINDVELDRRSPSEVMLGNLATELNLDKDFLCLLASRFPKDVEADISAAPPKIVTQAWQSFRKRISRR